MRRRSTRRGRRKRGVLFSRSALTTLVSCTSVQRYGLHAAWMCHLKISGEALSLPRETVHSLFGPAARAGRVQTARLLLNPLSLLHVYSAPEPRRTLRRGARAPGAGQELGEHKRTPKACASTSRTMYAPTAQLMVRARASARWLLRCGCLRGSARRSEAKVVLSTGHRLARDTEPCEALPAARGGAERGTHAMPRCHEPALTRALSQTTSLLARVVPTSKCASQHVTSLFGANTEPLSDADGAGSPVRACVARALAFRA